MHSKKTEMQYHIASHNDERIINRFQLSVINYLANNQLVVYTPLTLHSPNLLFNKDN